MKSTDLIEAATAAGATIIRSHGATIIVLADAATAPDDLIPFADCAVIAQCSVRTLGNARRSGALCVRGKQRSQVVRRGDLDKWIAEERAKPIAGCDDLDMRRRMKRIGRRAS